MRHPLTAFLAGLLAGALGFWLVSRHPAHETAGEMAKEEEEKTIQVEHETNGDLVLHVKKAAREVMDLRTAPVTQTNLLPEIKAYGRVLDPARLAALLAERESARASHEATRKEWERLKTLFRGEQNVSARAVEAAEAAARRDEALAASVEDRLKLEYGQMIAGQTNLSQLAQTLIRQEVVLVRVDFPLGTSVSNTIPKTARLAPAGHEDLLLPGHFAGSAGNVDPLLQSRGALFLAENKEGLLLPGMAVTAYCSSGGEPVDGVLLRGSSIIRAQGKTWVYVQTGEQEFVRKEISLQFPSQGGWFASGAGPLAGPVVIQGAQQLFSAEMGATVGSEEE